MNPKNIFSLIAIASLLLTSTACSDDKSVLTTGTGTLYISPAINADLNKSNVSRASDDVETELLQKLNIVVSNSDGEAVRYWNKTESMPWSDLSSTDDMELGFTLNAGTYSIEGWTGDSVPASFDKKFYKGSESVEIIGGVDTRATLTCRIANVAVSVDYSDDLDEVLSDYHLTISSRSGELTYDGKDERVGFFMMPKASRDLEWTLSGNDGNFEKTGKIENAKPATQYKLFFKYEADYSEMGAAAIKVDMVETPLETINEPAVILRARPDISGYTFDEKKHEPKIFEIGDQKPYNRATGYVGEVSVIVRSSGSLESVKLDIPQTVIANDISNSSIEMLNNDNNPDVIRLKEVGIEGSYDIDKEKETTSYKIIFRSEFTDNLREGKYPFTITAKDVDFESDGHNPKDRTVTFILNVSDDGAVVVEVSEEDKENATPTSLTFRGSVAKDGVNEVGFCYRKKGESDEDWKYVKADLIESRSIATETEFIKTVSGLQQGDTYEYTAAFDGERGSIIAEQSTPNPQLPNADFEDWNTSSSPYLIYSSSGKMFWDSGNHGSATMSKNVTIPDGNKKHSGKYSAKLQSQFVGIGSIGKFAAGNIFIGQYLETKGTNGVLGWGRPFEGLKYRPKQLKGYVKYKPATVGKYTNNNAPDIVSGQLDKGIIYIALLNNDCNVQGNGTFPVEVRTEDAHLFDKEATNVIAYGELVFNEATNGEDLIEFTIPLDYKSDLVPTYIMITASASKGGDYFAGADGSVMYLDDLELVY